MSKPIQFFSTVRRIEGQPLYSNLMRDYFQDSEKSGFRGSLIFQNGTNDVEPWVLAQDLLMNTLNFSPFIAVNPIYMHPYLAAHKVGSLANLYQRKIYLNFIAGTSLSEMDALNANLTHEMRYKRLEEYIKIIQILLNSTVPISIKSDFYTLKNAKLPYTVDKKYMPDYFIAGSSINAENARENTGCDKLEMARPINTISFSEKNSAIHFGIIAGWDKKDAIDKFNKRFVSNIPEVNQMLELTMHNTDAIWKKQLMSESDDKVFTTLPFKNLTSDCAYLVGSYDEVLSYVKGYIGLGYKSFVIETDHEDTAMASEIINMLNR
jgi:alkanesulfonate monooxygenase